MLRRSFVSLLAGLALVAACGGDSSTAPQQTRILLRNDSAGTIDEFYFSACTASSYGSNRISQPVAPGGSQTFDNIEPGCYDFLAGTVEGRVYESTGVNVPAGQTYTLRITN
jgi:hypothetical protein